jgi:AraC-like DNA-binding protein
MTNNASKSCRHACEAVSGATPPAISVGIPPHEYITQRRIDRVLDMLRMTNVPLLQIAVECGLRDQSHLCRVFRRVVGQSPNEWRRANTVDPRQVLHLGERSAPSAAHRPVAQFSCSCNGSLDNNCLGSKIPAKV